MELNFLKAPWIGLLDYGEPKMDTEKKLSPLKAIRSYCKLHCCCSDRQSWVNCTLTNCFLYDFRFGKKNVGNRITKTSSRKKQAVSLIDSNKNEQLEAQEQLK